MYKRQVYGGFGTSFTAYGFDLSLSFAYQLGGRILDYTYQEMMSPAATGLSLIHIYTFAP